MGDGFMVSLRTFDDLSYSDDRCERHSTIARRVEPFKHQC